jgi:hypothetical protein
LTITKNKTQIRLDSVLLSSVLLTITLLNLIPAGLLYFSSPTDTAMLAKFDAGMRARLQTWHSYGVASLAIILIGLIVTWTGYVQRSRSAWLVMSVITWAWAFPLFALPYLKEPGVFTLPEWIFNAIYEPGSPRSNAQLVATFSLMVLALLLPIRAFFFAGNEPASTGIPSAKLPGRSAVTVFLIALAVFIWIHAQVYELTPEEMIHWRVPPPPPPPPPAPTGSSTVDQRG